MSQIVAFVVVQGQAQSALVLRSYTTRSALQVQRTKRLAGRQALAHTCPK